MHGSMKNFITCLILKINFPDQFVAFKIIGFVGMTVPSENLFDPDSFCVSFLVHHAIVFFGRECGEWNFLFVFRPFIVFKFQRKAGVLPLQFGFYAFG